MCAGRHRRCACYSKQGRPGEGESQVQESCKPELVVNRRSDKAMVVICHPDPHSFNHALANEVQEAWSKADFNVTLRDLYLEGFNPIITAAEARGARSLDPLVAEHIQELLSQAAYWPSYTRLRIGFRPDEDRAPIRSHFASGPSGAARRSRSNRRRRGARPSAAAPPRPPHKPRCRRSSSK